MAFGQKITGGLREEDFIEIGQALAGISSDNLVQLRAMSSAPPGAIKAAFDGVHVIFGAESPTWADTVAFLRSAPTKTLAAKLASFDPKASVTPQMTRRLKPLVDKCPPSKVKDCAAAALPVAMSVAALQKRRMPFSATSPLTPSSLRPVCRRRRWVHAVYAYGAHHEALLSNYALMSPELATMPYSKLTRYQPWSFESKGPREIGFCWKTGYSERASAIELA